MIGITEAHICSLALISLISTVLKSHKAIPMLISLLIVCLVMANGFSKAFTEENLLRNLDLKRSKMS